MFGVRCEDYVMEGCQLSLSEAVIHQAGQTRGGGGEGDIELLGDQRYHPGLLTHTCITDQNVILNTKY